MNIVIVSFNICLSRLLPNWNTSFTFSRSVFAFRFMSHMYSLKSLYILIA